MIQKAIDKINKEFKGATLKDRYQKVVGEHVVDTLKEFCRQNSEFAQAVVQSSKSVSDCIAYTVKGCKEYTADIEVYRKAAEFYFPGAVVRFEMILDLGDDGFSNNKPGEEEPGKTEESRKPLRLSLDDLLD